MQLLSVNVSSAKIRRFGWQFYRSAFLKQAVTGPVTVNQHNIVGDKQADLMNHGGEDKAVYAFPYEHYHYWQKKLDLAHIPYGKFGDNLTVSGIDENDLAPGDQLIINDCILEVSQPRIPCYKISFEFQRKSMLNEFIASAHTGIYFRVIQPGTISAGQAVSIEKHPANYPSIKQLFRAYFDSQYSEQEAILRQSITIPELAEAWKSKMRDKCHLIDLYYQRQKKKPQ